MRILFFLLALFTGSLCLADGYRQMAIGEFGEPEVLQLD